MKNKLKRAIVTFVLGITIVGTEILNPMAVMEVQAGVTPVVGEVLKKPSIAVQTGYRANGEKFFRGVFFNFSDKTTGMEIRLFVRDCHPFKTIRTNKPIFEYDAIVQTGNRGYVKARAYKYDKGNYTYSSWTTVNLYFREPKI